MEPNSRSRPKSQRNQTERVCYCGHRNCTHLGVQGSRRRRAGGCWSCCRLAEIHLDRVSQQSRNNRPQLQRHPVSGDDLCGVKGYGCCFFPPFSYHPKYLLWFTGTWNFERNSEKSQFQCRQADIAQMTPYMLKTKHEIKIQTIPSSPWNKDLISFFFWSIVCFHQDFHQSFTACIR